jgi:hypothetical protein
MHTDLASALSYTNSITLFHPVHSLPYSVKFTAELCSYCFEEMQDYEVEITPCSATTFFKTRPVAQKLKEGWAHG